MRKPNFSKLSTDVLTSYVKDIEKLLAVRAKDDQKREKSLAKIKALALSEGVELSDLIDTGKTGRRKKTTERKAKAPRAKVAPKYRNPKNTKETWTGRGRKPKWVETYLKSGGKIEKIAIKK